MLDRLTALALTLAVVVSVKSATHREYSTEVNLNESETSDSPLATLGQGRKYLSDWVDDYEDNYDDDDDDEDGEEEIEEEGLQSDGFHPGTRYVNSDKPPMKKVDKFWTAFRPSHTSIRFGAGSEDVRSHEEVRNHHGRILVEAVCQIPQPRVVRVADHHPSASKTYSPSCTIVHQCSDAAGCCPPNQRCGPKRTKKLELPFYAIFDTPSKVSHHPRKAVRIERLAFYNHTECECQVRSDEMPQDVLPTQDPPPKRGGQDLLEKCRCPSPFNVRPMPGGLCTCECFDKQRDCIKYKRGKDYLNHEDRLCIEIRKCVVPTCDYGNYIRRSGRCPRKDEKYRF